MRKLIPPNEAAQLLLDSGLLGEINRTILGPRGLALVVSDNEDEATDMNPRVVSFYGLRDCRDDPEGITFSPELTVEVQAKVAAYDAANPLPPVNPPDQSDPQTGILTE